MQIFESRYGFFLGVERDDGTIEAPMHKLGAKATGCIAVFGTADYCASSPNVTTFKTAKSARQGLKRRAGA